MAPPSDAVDTRENVEFTVPGYAPLTFGLRDVPDAPAVVAVGFQKCGSSVSFRILRQLSQVAGVPYVDLPHQAFLANIPTSEWSKCDFDGFFRGGTIYGDFRTVPRVLLRDPVVRRARKILIVRDPRDALVSQYFSTAYSHGVPKKQGEQGGVRETILTARERAQASDIDAWVLEQAEHRNKHFLRGVKWIEKSKTARVWRYEDMVFDKLRFVTEMAEFAGLDVASDLLARIAQAADQWPEREDPRAFIRKVTPGDHREKLRPDTIARLNDILAEAMSAFDYT